MPERVVREFEQPPDARLRPQRPLGPAAHEKTPEAEHLLVGQATIGFPGAGPSHVCDETFDSGKVIGEVRLMCTFYPG